MTGQQSPGTTGEPSYDSRRQVVYWRLLARLFDHEEQAALESASLAVVEDIGLPPTLLDPQASVDSVVQRHPELAAEFDGLMVPEPEPEPEEDLIGGEPTVQDAVDAATALVNAGQQAKVKAALKSIGGDRVSNIPQSKVAAFIAALEG